MISHSRLFGIVACAALMVSSTAFAGIDCTCRYKGQDIPEGQTICMQLPSGNVLATCGRVLNNTAWKTIQQDCPYGQLNSSDFSSPIDAS